MRLGIPLVPVTVVIQFERRQMRPFPRRFRLRTLMAIVAMVALALASWLGLRRSEYRLWARFHADQEQQFLRMVANIERYPHSATTAGDAARARAAAVLHANEAERFQRGIFRAWEAIPPDPVFADLHRGASYKGIEKQFRRYK